MSERIGAALRRTVIERAHRCCEYCGVPDTATLLPHEPDHVVAVQHGGETTFENLPTRALSAIVTRGRISRPLIRWTGSVARLYDPRTQPRTDHFQWHEAVIEPLTAIGRATAFLLRINHEDRVSFRMNLLRQGLQLGHQ